MSVNVKNLCVEYGSKAILHDLSFEASSPSILGLVGPNGAGKSTIMKAITGFLLPSSGEITVCGITLASSMREAKKKIGYLPEENQLYGMMYVMESLYYHCGLFGIAHAKDRIEDVVRKVGLGAVVNKKIAQLSKGYRQRLGIALAIVHDPEVLILDEPSTGLDPNQLTDIRDLIKDQGRSKTIILSTHSLQEVEMLCDRVFMLNEGKMVYYGDLTSLSTDSQWETIESLFASLRVIEKD